MGPCKYHRPQALYLLYVMHNWPRLFVLPKDWLGYISASDCVITKIFLIVNNGIKLKWA